MKRPGLNETGSASAHGAGVYALAQSVCHFPPPLWFGDPRVSAEKSRSIKQKHYNDTLVLFLLVY